MFESLFQIQILKGKSSLAIVEGKKGFPDISKKCQSRFS